MITGVEIQGSTGVLIGAHNWPAMSQFISANDNIARDRDGEAIRTVTVRRKLDKSGVDVKIKVPVSEYMGVAVSTSITEDGVLSSAIQLVHGADQALNYKVFSEVGNDTIVAEWQNWGKKLRLPLFILAGDGQLVPYSQQVDGVLVGGAASRRKTSGESNRRPRFLNRRQPGLSVVGQ